MFLQTFTVQIKCIFTVYPLSTLPFLISDYKKKTIYYPTWCLKQLIWLLLYTSCNFKSIRSFHTEIWVSIAVSQFTYLYYALKVCTLFLKKKYIRLSICSRIVGTLWDILLRHSCLFNGCSVVQLWASCNCLNWPVNHLVTLYPHLI